MDFSKFRLNQNPFPAGPAGEHLFLHSGIEAALGDLNAAIAGRTGPAVVIGTAGVGKTSVLDWLANQWANERHVLVWRDVASTNRRELLQSLLYELDLNYGQQDEGALRLTLTDALRYDPRFELGVVAFVDEAQSLSVDLLDQLRLLSNIVRDGESQFQCILAGTQTVEERLAEASLESLNQRVSCRAYLGGIAYSEIAAYLEAQWCWAGGHHSPFQEDAIQAIHVATHGIPRLINQLCDHILRLLRSQPDRKVDESLVQQAWAKWQQLPLPELARGHAKNAEQSNITNSVEFGSLDDDLFEAKDSPSVSNPQDVSASGIVASASGDVDAGRIPMPPSMTVPSPASNSESSKPSVRTGYSQYRGVAEPTPDDIASLTKAEAVSPSSNQSSGGTMIKFAFEADIQKPSDPPRDTTSGAESSPHGTGDQGTLGDQGTRAHSTLGHHPGSASHADAIIRRMETQFDTIDQALTAADTSLAPVDELLLEADLNAISSPVEIMFSEPTAGATSHLNDPSVVFQDHLYIEALWVDDPIWTGHMQASAPSREQESSAEITAQIQATPLETIPPAVNDETSTKSSFPVWHDEAVLADGAQTPPVSNPATSMPTGHESVAAISNSSMSAAIPPVEQAKTAQLDMNGIRIDEEGGSPLNPPRSLSRWDQVKSIDSPGSVDWSGEWDADSPSNQPSVSAQVLTPGDRAFEDDASIIFRQSATADSEDVAHPHQPQQHVPHPGHAEDERAPLVLARRKDLRALLNALRGY